MRIRIFSITHKIPAWLQAGYKEYAKRLQGKCVLELIEIPAAKRLAKSNLQRLMEQEGEKILSLIKPGQLIIALDVKGELWSTELLAKNISYWQQEGRNIDFIIGGPDGLSKKCLQKADKIWSLSKLTFPHNLVRLILAEQIYRAFSILQQHPYHR